jgi:3-keto-5-aminohexanoate cleavage enzyme
MTESTWNYGDSYEWLRRQREGLGPVIITCAVNGGVQGREANPALPETPEEIAAQAREAYDAGASVVHIHGRSPDNLAAAADQAEVYAEINHLVRQACPDIVINNTTGGGLTTTMEDRFRCLTAAPEMASLNLGPEMVRLRVGARPAPLPHPHDGFEVDTCVAWTYGIIEQLATVMRAHGVKPELETYHNGQYWVSRTLIEKGLIDPPYVHQFVMGYQTSTFPTPANVCELVRELPAQSVFFVAGIGPYQTPMNVMALLLGGHVRVGLEDNIYARRGAKLTGNGEAVERIAAIAQQLGREVASPAEARGILGLAARPRGFVESVPGG